MELQPFELQRIVDDAAERAVKLYRIEKGEEQRYISENKAFKRFGRSIVERWVLEELITPIQDGPGSRKRYDIMKLESLAQTSNRTTYLSIKERKKKVNLLGQALERHNLK